LESKYLINKLFLYHLSKIGSQTFMICSPFQRL